MARKWIKCQKRKIAAEAILVGHNLSTLCQEWTSQVASQTKPLPSMCLVFFILLYD